MAQLGSTNIGTVEVRQAIGLGVDDFGLLCSDLQIEKVGSVWQAKVPHVRANRINKWSKWKPVKYASPLGITDTILKNQNYGLTIPINSYSVLRTYAITTLDILDESTQIKWDYDAPSGTATEPFRIDDFRNYQPQSTPLFDPYKIVSGGSGVGIAWDGYGLLKWTMNIAPANPQTGQILPTDLLNYDILRLGVMLIDYDSDNNEIVLIKANDAHIGTSQSIVIDITDLNASTYIVCLFLYSNELGGFAQINNPTTEQIEAISGIFYLRPIENGMRPVGLPGFYQFVMWAFVGKGGLSAGFETNDYYTLSQGADLPIIYTTKDTPLPTTSEYMVWDDVDNYFDITPKVNFDPPHYLKWNLEFSIYIADTAWWINDTWRCLVGWDDIDDYSVCLLMKTVLTEGYKYIHLAFYNFNEEPFVETYASTIVLSESNTAPTIIKLSNYNGDTRIMSVSINGIVVLTNDALNTVKNPPVFRFGDTLDDNGRAPKGLGYRYISLDAIGQDTSVY